MCDLIRRYIIIFCCIYLCNFRIFHIPLFFFSFCVQVPHRVCLHMLPLRHDTLPLLFCQDALFVSPLPGACSPCHGVLFCFFSPCYNNTVAHVLSRARVAEEDQRLFHSSDGQADSVATNKLGSTRLQLWADLALPLVQQLFERQQLTSQYVGVIGFDSTKLKPTHHYVDGGFC